MKDVQNSPRREGLGKALETLAELNTEMRVGAPTQQHDASDKIQSVQDAVYQATWQTYPTKSKHYTAIDNVQPTQTSPSRRTELCRR